MDHREITLNKLKSDGQEKLQNNRPTEAKVLYAEAVRLNPADANAWHMLSAINGMLGLFEESEACARKVISLLPDTAAAYTNLGAALLSQNKVGPARQAYERALQINPQDHAAINNLGNIFLQQHDYSSAIEAYKKALEIRPDYAEACNNLGNAYLLLQKPQDALKILQTALRLKPDYMDAIFNYAKALQELGQYQQALDTYEHVLQLKPDHFNASFGVGDVLQKQGDTGKAIQCYEKLLQRKPDNARLLATLAGIKKDNLELDEAILLYRQAVETAPDDNGLYSNYLLSLNYLDADSNIDIAGEHREWGRHVEEKYRPGYTFTPARPREKLTIGFISHDFRTHSVAYFFEPVVKHYDHSKFRFICYANMAACLEDDTTGRIRDSVDLWRNITDLSDRKVAETIYADKVDILFDLSGHTAWNRLPVFALRPAPLQVSWLGYPNTSGLKSMDLRLTDQIADPEGVNDSGYTEKILRLPGGFLTYLPPASAPDTGTPPVSNNQYITFGSFNTLAKIGHKTIDLWSRLLQAVPDSRLLLKNGSFASPATRKKFLALMTDRNIDPDRITLCPQSVTIWDHLALYGKVDIALDTFPYNGTTTTCEALWMGVPVVTLSGDTHVSRVTHSILHRLGLDWLVAGSPDQYIDIAGSLASDVDQLVELRGKLRQKFKACRLGQYEQFTREFETVLTQAWDQHGNSSDRQDLH